MTARYGTADPAVWLAVALLLTLGAFGVVLADDGGDVALDRPERAVLLTLIALVVVVGGFVLRRLRPPAVAAGAVLALALAPWGGAERALLVALVGAVGLAVLVTDILTRGPKGDRPHPLLRVAVAVPALALTVVGALFLPVAAAGPAHAQLADWITGPASAGGTFAVPPALWGDLVQDGVPPERLVLTAGAGAAAEWTVEVGGAVPGAVAGFGTGPAAVAVLPLPPRGTGPADGERTDGRVQGTPGSPPTAEQRLGAVVAASPGLLATPEVRSVLRDGGVDARVLVVLAGLTAEHTVEVGAIAGGETADPPVLGSEIVVTALDGRSTTLPEVAAALTRWLQGRPQPFAPSVVIPAAGGVTVGWSEPPPPP